jgi:hypothetical protein
MMSTYEVSVIHTYEDEQIITVEAESPEEAAYLAEGDINPNFSSMEPTCTSTDIWYVSEVI